MPRVLLLLALVESTVGLRVNFEATTRRAAIGAAASILPLGPLAALAVQLPNPATQVVESEAKTMRMVDSSWSCSEIDQLIVVDREAEQFQLDKLNLLADEEASSAGLKTLEESRKAIRTQISTLEKQKKINGCFGNLRKKSDAEVYARADGGSLTAARVIERAKKGELVDGSSATCKELADIIEIDKKAIKFERDRLDALGQAGNEAEIRTVERIENSIKNQIEKLEKLRTTKKSC